MEKIVLFLGVVLLGISVVAEADINLDAGPYSDDFSTSKYQIDALGFDFANVYIPASEETTCEGGNLECLTLFQAENGDRPYVDYGFTRSDASKPGAITFDGIDHASGGVSWLEFIYDCDDASYLAEQFNGTNFGTSDNILNLMGGLPVIGHCRSRLAIPTGANRMYIRFCTPWYGPDMGSDFMVGIDNLHASADASELDAKNTIILTAENPSYSDDYQFVDTISGPEERQRWEEESYCLTGSIMHKGADNYIRFWGKEASITYKFEVPGGTNQVVIDVDAVENSSGNHSWFWIEVFDATGMLIAQNNICNLTGGAGGAGTFMVDLPVGTTTFGLKLGPTLGANNEVNEGVAPYIARVDALMNSLTVTANNIGSLIDSEPDGDIDAVDLSVLADNWLDIM